MRIVSLLPSSTEIVYALGLGDQLVGVTHECDYPPDAKSKPVVVRSSFKKSDLNPQQIDEEVSRTLKSGQSLYVVDEEKLRELSPDLILTQDLCQVCAPSGQEIGRVVKFLPDSPAIVWLSPNCLSDIFENIQQVGEAAGRLAEAKRIIESLKVRVRKVTDRTSSIIKKPRVFCMEWLYPPYQAGHWMPELVELAGGEEGLGQKGKDSRRISWDEVRRYAPEVLILCPCGYHLEGTIDQVHLLTHYPDWNQIPAVKEGRVYAVDANSYFARPGPRIVDGLELLAAIIHPEKFTWSGEVQAYQRLNRSDLQKYL
jgi:iron complex transport system substrate-binding protein